MFRPSPLYPSQQPQPSFGADGDGQRSGGSGTSGTGGVEAQRHELPVMKSSAFFGDDVGGLALEDGAGGGVSLSSSVPGNLSSLNIHHHHHHAGGAFSTGASPARSGDGSGVGSSGGTVGTPSPRPLDGSSLVAALQNQLSF